MLPAVSRDAESRFWHRQLIEHAAFMHLAMPAEQQGSVRKALGKILGHLTIYRNEATTVAIAEQLIDIQETCLGSFAPPGWIGFLSPSIFRHMLAEERWYLGMVQNRHTPAELLHFAAKNSEEAATLLCRALDPSEGTLSERSEIFASRLSTHAVQNTFAFAATMADGMAEIEKFSRFVDGRDVGMAEKSASSAWLEHQGREGRYFVDHLRRTIQHATG